MDGGVQILPDESVMFHIPKLQEIVSHQLPLLLSLDEVLLSDVPGAEVSDPVDRDYPDVFDGAQ